MDTSKMFKKRDKKEKKKKDKSHKKHHRREDESEDDLPAHDVAVPDVVEEQSEQSEDLDAEVDERDNVKVPSSSSVIVEQEPSTMDKKDSKWFIHVN